MRNIIAVFQELHDSGLAIGNAVVHHEFAIHTHFINRV
jgi:hypothetical protein